MKKLLLVLVVVGLCQVAQAQKIRLNVYGAYAFDDRFDSYYDAYNYYNGKIEGGFQYGGGLGYMVNPYYMVEVLYLRQDTHAPTSYLTGGGFNYDPKFANFELGLNYIMLAGQRVLTKEGSKVEGYGGLMGGLAIANAKNPENGHTGSASKFAWGLRGGANIWVADAVAIKLQAQLLSISQAMGGSVYFGSGGAGAGLSSYSSIFQFTIGGGLAFRFGN